MIISNNNIFSLFLIVSFFGLSFSVSDDVGEILFFPDACPSGWTVVSEAAGRFILSAGTYSGNMVTYAVNSIGGENSVLLTTDHLPSHNHKNGAFNGLYAPGTGDTTMVNYNQGTDNHVPDEITIMPLSSVGNSVPHNNLPPYYVLVPCRKTINYFLLSQEQNSVGLAWNSNFTIFNSNLNNSQINDSVMRNNYKINEKNVTDNLNLTVVNNNNSANFLIVDLQNKTDHVFDGILSELDKIDVNIDRLKNEDSYLKVKLFVLFEKLDNISKKINSTYAERIAADNTLNQSLINQGLEDLRAEFKSKMENSNSKMSMSKILMILSLNLSFVLAIAWGFIMISRIYQKQEEDGKKNIDDRRIMFSTKTLDGKEILSNQN